MVWFTWNHPERLTEAHLSARFVSLTKNGRAMWASKPADFLFLRKLLHNPWDLIVNVKTLAFHSECLLFIYFQVIVKHSSLNNHLFGHCTLHVRRKKHHEPCAGPEKILQSQAPGCFSACRFAATVRVTHGSWMIFLLKLQLLENTPHGRSWKSSTFWGIQNSQRSWMKGRSAGMIINNDDNIIICIVCSVQLLYMYINDIVKMEEVLNQTLSISTGVGFPSIVQSKSSFLVPSLKLTVRP